MVFTINPQSFNAVLACAGKGDLRQFLTGFFVDVTNSRLVATNGHVLATAPLDKVEGVDDVEPETHGLLKGFLFQGLQRPISNSGDKVYIDCAVRTLRYWSGKQWRTVDLKPINACYVDYTRVLYDGETQPITTIGFNAEYVARPARWAGFDFCTAFFEFNGQLNCIGVRYLEKTLADVRLTLMPARI